MSETSGLADLLPYLGDPPTVALLAIKAPIGQVTGALVDRHGSRAIENAPARPSEGASPEPCDWVAVVRARDESWTLVYRSFESFEELTWNGLEEDGIDLVRTLDTRAVLLGLGGASGTDRALVLSAEGVTGLDLDEEASVKELIEEEATWRDGEFESFHSTLREEPFAEGDAVPEDFVARLLRDRGLWVLPCWPRAKGDDAFLVVAEIDPGRIERADLLDLASRSAYDEETLELRRSELEEDLRSVAADAASESTDGAEDGEGAGSGEDSRDRSSGGEPGPTADARSGSGAGSGSETESESLSPPEPATAKEPQAPSRLEGFLNRLLGRGNR